MEHVFDLESIHLDGAWLTIGSFDGVHRGHQRILRELTAGAHAEGAPAVVLTFYPHPAVVLRGIREGYYLTTPEEKAALIEPLGVDVLITHPFNEQVAHTPARTFLARLQRHLHMRHLWVGFNFALGHNREGDLNALRRWESEFGYRLRVFPPVVVDGMVVSSTAIRVALMDGDVALAAHWLGRPYALQGTVVRGDGRGRRIGVPTANLSVLAERMLPAAGVYVCRAQVGERTLGAVTNIGVRPTFEAQPAAPRVEAHLLDFEGDLYGQSMRLTFLTRLRGERRFPTVDALRAQIAQDIAQARALLAKS